MLARLIAIMVMVASAGVLTWHHRDDLFPAPEEEATSINPEREACLTQRFGEIDTMIADGIINQQQADQFRTRAEAFCIGTTAPGS